MNPRRRVVPAATQNDVWVLGVILQREDSVGVARRLLHVTPLQRGHLPLGRLVVDPEDTILASGGELAAVVEVIQASATQIN